MHRGKTVPAGNWTLIAAEVERDQLATMKKRVHMTKVEGKGGGVRRMGGHMPL